MKLSLPTYLALVALLPATTLAFIGTGQFFPYGPSSGDATVPVADDNFIPFNLTNGARFNFFNHSYNSFFVANNGGLSFLQGVSTYTPTCGPLNTPMIVPYWADVDTRFLNGSVYFRESRNASLLSKARAEVQLAFPGLTNLNINWLFITTWDRVTFYGAGQGNCSNLAITNTFQSILVTDGTLSFAIFNYNNITWTTGTASGGNCFGLGGVPAKAGFDLGDGSTFFSIPGSCTANISGVEETTNVGQPGKWIFRIDQANITAPPNNNTNNATTMAPPTTWQPTMAPTTWPPTTWAPPTTWPTTTWAPPTTWAPTSMPTNTSGPCDPKTCLHRGHCFSYFYCDHMTSTWMNRTCPEGLYWNPDSGYGLRQNGTNGTNPISNRTGSCDVWSNLSWNTRTLYLNDSSCFPPCYFGSNGNCSNSYRYHPEGSDAREIKNVTCPLDSRPMGGYRPLVWVQERETCDFCYNALSWNGFSCCSRYDGGNSTGNWNPNPFNGTFNYWPTIGGVNATG